MENQLKIIPTDLLEVYLESFPVKVKEAFEQLHDAEISTDTFSFYTSVSSVFSSKIEGEEIELDSYIKYKRFGLEFLPDYTKKIDDLYNAYTYAKNNDMTQEHIQVVHQLLSKHILSEAYHGRVRTQNMYITTSDGRIEYVAASPFIVNRELELFYEDLRTLINATLSFEEIFYFASMVHLVFVKIHPWNDGNGRSARLLEKWFLAHFLGEKTWFIQSEKHYYQHHNTYYQNIRLLGLEYTELDYAQALPFLQMLPNSLLNY
mgnify:CR=1 FL=1